MLNLRINFEEVYGKIDKDFIEGHHIVHISKMNKNNQTRIEDIIMVGSNCNSMLNRKRHWLCKEDLK